MHTFSACWQAREADEQYYIDAVVKHCQTAPHKVFPTEEELAGELDALVYHHDEPLGGLSPYAQWRVMKLARQHGVKVLLDGQGGDECLCGYKKFSFFFLKSLLCQRHILRSLRHVAGALLRGDGSLLKFGRGQRYLPAALRRFYPQPGIYLRSDWRRLARQPWSSRMRDVVGLHEHQLADLQMWSLPTLLQLEDRNSMAHSIESRVPLIDDHRFVEHCLRLPEPFFFRQGKTKRVLTTAMGDALPTAVHRRRTKKGFETPQAAWLRGPLGMVLERAVRDSKRLAEVLDTAAAGDAFAAYRSGARGVGAPALLRIAGLGLWLERFAVDIALPAARVRPACHAAAA